MTKIHRDSFPDKSVGSSCAVVICLWREKVKLFVHGVLGKLFRGGHSEDTSSFSWVRWPPFNSFVRPCCLTEVPKEITGVRGTACTRNTVGGRTPFASPVRNSGVMLPRQMPTSSSFRWFPRGAGFCPPTVFASRSIFHI